MNKLFLLLTALLLTSCIDVESFGSAWNKTGLDPAVIGTWDKLVPEGADNPMTTVYIRERDGAYEVENNDPESRDDKPLYPVKTLAVGPYHFLLTGPKNGGMVRYVAEEDRVTTYELNADAALTFIKKKMPKSANFKADSMMNSSSHYLKIGVLDKEALKMLAAIPDTPEYWRIDTEYKQQ